jgi:hypothetical protein
MSGSPDTVPAPRLQDERRLALVVATQTYRDPSLRQLRAPARDIRELTDVLADPEVGDFTVTSVVDQPAHEIMLAIEDFLTDRRTDDLLLIYLSCHGLVDPRRRLFFAASDTRKDRLAATGVEAQWLLDQLDDCRARRQVVILDCCFSGAFANTAKGDADLGLAERFNAAGRGRVVLTASRGSEYSFEGKPVPGSAMPGSIFTSALVEGIRRGAADLDRDGLISVDDAYTYTFDRLRSTENHQTPQRWLYGAEGDIFLARSPAGVTITPAVLPDGLRSGLESPHLKIRLGAVDTLGEWLTDSDPARVLAARQALDQVIESEVPKVAARAQVLLGEAMGAVSTDSTELPQREPPTDSRQPADSDHRREPGDGGAPINYGPGRRRRLILIAMLAALAFVGALAVILLWKPGGATQLTTSPSPSSTTKANPADPPGKPLLVERFDTRKFDWVGRGGRYVDDTYRIDVESDAATSSPRQASSVYPSAPTDLRIEVDARSLRPLDEVSGFGVVCHLNEGTKDRYQFTIGEGPEGTVRITKSLNDRVRFLVARSVAFFDATDVNRLRAECTQVRDAEQPSVRLVFRLNGRVVAKVTDDDQPLLNGTVGIRAFSKEGGIRAEFDNFVATPL